MTHKDDNIDKLFKIVTLRLDEFINQIQEKDGNLMATDKWTVDDVLRHITFWHINYSKNYQALVQKKEPPLLDGPYYILNIEGVAALQKYSRGELIKMLKKAHKNLEKSILTDKVTKIQYKKDGPIYTPNKLLEVVEAHLRSHLKQIKKAK